MCIDVCIRGGQWRIKELKFPTWLVRAINLENVYAKLLARGSDLKDRIDGANVSAVLGLIEFTWKRTRQNNGPAKKETYSSVPGKRDVRHHLYIWLLYTARK